jgi:hypothetical protein
MKRIIILLLFCSTLSAQKAEFGVGIILGEPTGISIKQWMNETVDIEGTVQHIGSLARSWWSTKSLWLPRKNAWDAAIAWSLFNKGHLHLHGDYLWHDYTIFPPELGIMPLYYGIGGRFRFGSGERVRIGIRGVLGINYLFEQLPVDAFLEFVPVFDLLPKTELEISAAIGVRYYFRQSLKELFE